MNIKIDFNKENCLQIAIPYDTDVINAVKKVPGRRWDPKKKVWIFSDRDGNTQLFLREVYKIGRFNAAEAKRTGDNNDNEVPAALEKAIRHLKLKNYSLSTIKSYTKQIEWFFSKDCLEAQGCQTGGYQPVS